VSRSHEKRVDDRRFVEERRVVKKSEVRETQRTREVRPQQVRRVEQARGQRVEPRKVAGVSERREGRAPVVRNGDSRRGTEVAMAKKAPGGNERSVSKAKSSKGQRGSGEPKRRARG
jgi:hypothetical protein